MLRRARLWLLYKVAVWVWSEQNTFKEFVEGGHQKYIDRANPNLYSEVEESLFWGEMTEREKELCGLVSELDAQALTIHEATETAEAELTELSKQRWAV